MSFLKRRSRGKFEPICEQKISAHFLGKYPAKGKVGLSVINGPVAALYNQFRETPGKRVLLEVKNDGLWIKQSGGSSSGISRRRANTVDKPSDLRQSSNNPYVISVDDISFGAVDSNLRKVFAIIVRKTGTGNADHPWECHAFLCNSHADAKTLTMKLVATFQKVAQAKGLTVGSSSNPNTIHIFTENLSPKYQRKGSKNGSVTTLKITFNVEKIETNWNEPSEYNINKHISKMLSKSNDGESRELRWTDEDELEDKTNTPPSGSSDKENEGSDSDLLDEPAQNLKPRTTVVAVNTGLTELTAVQEDGSDEDTQMPAADDNDETESAQKLSPIPPRTKPKPRKNKRVRFTAEISYIE